MIDDFLLTKLSAGFLTLFYLFLSFRIGYFRGSPVMKFIFKIDKDISEKKLERNVRAHGNFSEYVPIFLTLFTHFTSSTAFCNFNPVCFTYPAYILFHTFQRCIFQLFAYLATL